ncbi:MAG: DnaB-like helicase N-terminal domain-containing protein [Dehalococcoidia bacterium]|nr:DnaB-like helicase N-terminal domain-containing protein [Dehalococcoidia bacterium]
MTGRLPPYDINAEESVLGSILIDSEAIDKIDGLMPADFFSERNMFVFDVMKALRNNSEKINQINVAQELNARKKLEVCGGAAYLSHLIGVCPQSLDVDVYADIVTKLAAKRRLIQIADQISGLGYDIKNDPANDLDKAMQLLHSVQRSSIKTLELSNLRIIKTQPPHYVISVNGQDMKTTPEIFANKEKFALQVMTTLDWKPTIQGNQAVWDNTINKLMAAAQKIEAPADTSLDAEVKLAVLRHFQNKGEGTEVSQIQGGCFYVGTINGAEYWCFQPTPLMKALKKEVARPVAWDLVWTMMLDWGATAHQFKVGTVRMPLKLKCLPVDFAHDLEFGSDNPDHNKITMENTATDATPVGGTDNPQKEDDEF